MSPPRILRVTYRASRGRRRKATVFVKVPYGQAFDLSAKLTRLQQSNEILYFRVGTATRQEIGEHRKTLTRWPEALRTSAVTTGVNLDI